MLPSAFTPKGGDTAIKSVQTTDTKPEENFFTTDRLIKAMNANGLIGPSTVDRPSNINFKNLSQYNFADMYFRAGWFYNNVSILSTIVLRIIKETLRYGIEWQDKFVLKCESCGEFYDEHTDQCNCGSRMLRPPMESQKNQFVRLYGDEEKRVSILEEANDNGKTLTELCRAFLEQALVYNFPVVLARCQYIMDPDTDDGTWIDRIPLEFIQCDPLKTKKIFDDTGRPGDGTGFTLDNRSTVYDMEEYGGYFEGKRLYPAHWKLTFSYGDSGEAMYFMDDEVYTSQLFGESLNYGYPVCLHAHDALMTYYYIEKRNAKEIEKGHPRGILSVIGMNETEAMGFRGGLADLMDDDPYGVPVLTVPPMMGEKSGNPVVFTPMSMEPYSERLGLKNEIRDRICALYGVPNIFVTDVSQSGGMNNESQQITVFDRSLDDDRQYTETFLQWVLSFYDNITDFNLIVSMGDPKDPDDDLPESQKRMNKIQEAMMLQQLGLELIRYKDGEFEFSEEPTAQEDPFGGMFGDMGGGMDGGGGMDDMGGFDDDISLSADKPKKKDNRITKRDARIAKARNWRKEVDEEAWHKFLAKDAYSVINLRKDDLMRMLDLKESVTPYFKSIPHEDVRKVYHIIIDELSNPRWSRRLIEMRLREVFPDLPDKNVKLIARSEIGRIINLAKQIEAEEQPPGTKYYWTGPSDERTTDECKWLKREMRHGVTIDRLKEIMAEGARKFNQPLISPTGPIHPNCRHTYQRMPKQRAIISQERAQQAIDGLPTPSPDDDFSMTEVIKPVQPSYGPLPISSTGQGATFMPSAVNGMAMFAGMTASEVADISRTVVSYADTNVPRDLMEMMLLDAYPTLSQMEIRYIIDNAPTIYAESLKRGYIEV